MKKPDEIKKRLERCKNEAHCDTCPSAFHCQIEADALAYIQQLEDDKKRLHERIANQRRQLRLLHALYEWALSRLRKAGLNDHAHLQAWLRDKGYAPCTFDLPEPPKEEEHE